MDRMKTVLITGGGGYIGKTLHDNLKDDYEVTLLTRADLDVSNFISLNRFLEGKYFDVVLHCAVQGGSRLRQDSYEDMDINLTMYYNLVQLKQHFGKLISFGSDAEVYATDTPYGKSKQVINNSISGIDGFFNIRIFAVFDENELDTRFIKSNIVRYINRKEIFIHQDKQMDFFYISDLLTLIRHYIDESIINLPKISECSYDQNYTLSNIADIINRLSDYKVSIKTNSDTLGSPYVGKSTPNLNLIGLEEGIKKTYDYLFKKHVINCVEFY